MRVRWSLLCLKWTQFLTPGNVSVPTKNILVFLNNCYHIFLSIATSVEGIACPAMWRGSVAKQPVRIISNGRNQELTKICEVRFIFRQYNWIFYVSCNSRKKNTDGLHYMSLYVEKESVVDPHSGYFATPRHHRKNYVPSTRKLHFHHVGPFSKNLYIKVFKF